MAITTTTPTALSIVKEGLERAGFPDPDATLVNRAQNVWLGELVNEIVNSARATGIGVLKVLETTAYAIGVINQSRYALPDDYDHRLSVAILDGDNTDTVVSGDSSAVTLAAAETISTSDAEGRHVLITAGTAKGQYRQITDYDSTTKVATVDVPWDTGKTPLSGDTYVIVDDEDRVFFEYVPTLDVQQISRTPGCPQDAFIYNGELNFDRPLDKTYGLKLRYYADPAKIDRTDARWTDLYTRWQHILTLGIQRYAYEESDDESRFLARFEERWQQTLIATIRREQPDYGQFEGFAL